MSGRGPLEEHYASHPVYGAFPREARRAGTVPIDFLRVEQGALDAVDPAIPFLMLTLNVGLPDPVGARFDCGDGWFGGTMRRGDVCITPPDADLHCRVEGPNTILAAPLPMDALAAALGRERAALAAELAPLSSSLHADPLTEQLLLSMWQEAARDDPASTLLIDGALMALAARLLRMAGRPGLAPPPRLDDRRLQRAVEHVEASLSETITLGDMAAVACLSPFHFNRAFGAATGLSPHRYVTARRVERARAMLADPAIPLAQVAYACGFASQSHFGQVFKAHTGATPGAWRAGAAR